MIQLWPSDHEISANSWYFIGFCIQSHNFTLHTVFWPVSNTSTGFRSRFHPQIFARKCLFTEHPTHVVVIPPHDAQSRKCALTIGRTPDLGIHSTMSTVLGRHRSRPIKWKWYEGFLFSAALTMQLFASLALLALLKPHPALAATVAANVKHITLDIVNAHVAPDGFSRCMFVNHASSYFPSLTHSI